MAFINEFLDQLYTYGKLRVTLPDGTIVDAIGFDVEENGVTYQVWRAEKYIYQNGTLSGEVSLSGFTNSNSNLYYHLGQGGEEGEAPGPLVGQAIIIGIDLTNYSYLDFSALASSNSYWGSETYCKYGIDSANNTLFSYEGYKDSDASPISYAKTMDVSAYTGVHKFIFECKVHAATTNPDYHSNMDLYVSSIRLYN